MTTGNITIASTDVSANIRRIEIWRKVNEAGRFQLFVNSPSSQYVNVFSGDAPTTISIDSAVLLKGYLDLVKNLDEDTEQIALIESFKPTGRDMWQDLQNKLYDYIYYPQPADDIIADLLTKAGAEVTYTSTHSLTSIPYDSRSAYLSDSFKEIFEYVDAEGYVDQNKALNLILIGRTPDVVPDSGITLKSVAGASDNNIIHVIDHDEADTFDIRNYIIVFGADKVNDHWTEGNASDWTGETGNIISDYYATDGPPPLYTILKGAAAIRADIGTGTAISLSLTFPKYNHTNLDWSKITSGELSYIAIRQFQVGHTDVYGVCIQLKDTLGNIISFVHGKGGTIPPQSYSTGEIQQQTVPIGTYTNIADNLAFDQWYYSTAITKPFNWKIVKIEFFEFLSPTYTLALIVDGLVLPTEVISVAQDGSSQGAYKVRDLPLTRKDIGSQRELDLYSSSVLAKWKDPTDRLVLRARGDIGLIGGAWKWIPGYAVTVNIPGKGLNNAAYRMIEIHHIIDRENPTRGFTHTVELQLIPKTQKFQTQRWSYGPASQISILRRLRDRVLALEKVQTEVRDWYPSLPKPLWQLYGNIPSDGLNVDASGANLIVNPSFEYDYNNDGVPDKWTPITLSGSPTFGRDNGIVGAYSAKIVCPDAASSGRFDSDFIPVRPSNQYYFSVQLKANNSNGTARLRLFWFKSDKTASSIQPVLDIQVGSPPITWTFWLGTASSPSDAAYAKVSLVIDTTLSGTNTCLFDDTFMSLQIPAVSPNVWVDEGAGNVSSFSYAVPTIDGATEVLLDILIQNATSSGVETWWKATLGGATIGQGHFKSGGTADTQQTHITVVKQGNYSGQTLTVYCYDINGNAQTVPLINLHIVNYGSHKHNT